MQASGSSVSAYGKGTRGEPGPQVTQDTLSQLHRIGPAHLRSVSPSFNEIQVCVHARCARRRGAGKEGGYKGDRTGLSATLHPFLKRGLVHREERESVCESECV